MRTDVKIGLAVGLGLLLLVVVYFAFVGGEAAPSEDLTTADKPSKPFGTVEVAKKEEVPKPLAVAPKPAPVVSTVRTTVTPVTKSPSLSPAKPMVVAAKPADPRTITPSYAPTIQPPAVRTGETPTTPTISPTPKPLVVSPTPAPVAVVKPSAPTPVATPKKDSYTVQEGDGGFWAISEKVYGNGKHWELIQKANPQANPNQLHAGQILVIPPLPKTPVASVGPTTPSPVNVGSSGQKTYTVVKGDAGFWGIAAKEYGNGKYWTLLAKANPGVDSNALKVGQVLIVPPKPSGDRTAAPAPVAKNSKPASSGSSRTYTVQAGDNGFWGVAQKMYGNGKYHDVIASANPQVDPQKLQVGQELVIPPLPAAGEATSALPRAPKPTSSGSAADDRPFFD